MVVGSFLFGFGALSGAAVFSDVKVTDWFYGDVMSAQKAGIVQGSNGKFRPYDYITRAETIAIMERSRVLTDLESLDANALDDVYWALVAQAEENAALWQSLTIDNRSCDFAQLAYLSIRANYDEATKYTQAALHDISDFTMVAKYAGELVKFKESNPQCF